MNLMWRHASSNMALLLCCCLLVGCGDDGADDLDQFMASASQEMSRKVEALPQVLPYTPLQYNADGTLSSPFKAKKTMNKTGGLQPNTNRPKEALEEHPLESLKYVGTLSKEDAVSKQNMTFALIKTPDGTLQQVKIGNYVGPNFGLITQIDDNGMIIKEIVQDDLTGDWVERNVSMHLQEQ
jgi:type IV pilus assembly protein PilP